MDIQSKRTRILIAAATLILLFMFAIAIVVINNNNKNTDVNVTTAEEYDGPPTAGIYGEKFDEFYSLISANEYNYLQYALGDFFRTNQGVSNLLTKVKVENAIQSYADSKDIVNFRITLDDNGKSYDVMIVRSLNDSFETRLIVKGYDFDVILSNYIFMN